MGQPLGYWKFDSKTLMGKDMLFLQELCAGGQWRRTIVVVVAQAKLKQGGLQALA